MPKVCRLCTKSTINRNSKKLFDKRKLVAQIEEITGIVLKNVKSLPQHICKVCREDLQKAHEFRLRCITSQEYFNSVDFTCTKDVPSEGFEIKHEVPIIDEFNDSTKVIVESCFLKTENKDVLRADNGLFDKDDSNCCGYKHSNYSTDMQHDELRLGASANIVDTTKVTAVLIPQEKKIKKTEIIQQKRRKKSEKVIFVCDQCGMSFSYRSHFLAHQRRHTGEKVFHCEICPEKFFENFQLKVHLRRHKGEKPFSCEFCGIRFLKNNAKKLHVRRRHTNVRPYVCSQCSKAFAVSSMLTNHMLTHTGEKTFRCDVCDIWFGRKTNLVKHYRSLSHKQSEKRTAVKLE